VADSQSPLEKLGVLAAGDRWKDLDRLVGEPPFVEISPQVTELLATMASARESSGDKQGALHCYRLAIWNNALYLHAAKGSEEWQQRWSLGSSLRWPFQKLAKNLEIAEEHWHEYFPELRSRAEAGDLERAEALLVMLESTPDENSPGSVRVADRLEEMGDDLVGPHREAARWCYRLAAQRFQWWVASSTSGGEGLARSAETNTAAAKLARMDLKTAG
jgi:hypothetical protein